MKKFNVKDITEGALYVAFYGILSLLTRYLISGVDSMIYYIYPLPMAILAARKEFRVSLIATLASIAVSFIFANPLYVVILMMPNIIAGLILGTFLKKTPKQILTYIIIFIIFLVSSYYSIWLFEKINETGYWDGIVEFASKFINIFSQVDESSIKRIVTAVCVVVIIIDALIKEVFNVLLFFLLVNRLGLVKDLKVGFRIPLKYHFLLAIVYILMFGCSYIALMGYLIEKTKIFEILFIICFSIYFMIGIYIIYQVMMYFRLKFSRMPNWGIFLITLGAFLVFPITHLFGLVLNFINYNFIKDSL